MTEVKITQTCKGTQDGFTVEQFEKGQVVDIRESLARQFFAEGKAEKTFRQHVYEWYEATQEKGAMKDISLNWMREGLAKNKPEYLDDFDMIVGV